MEKSSVYNFDPDNYFITEIIGFHNTISGKPELWRQIKQQPMVLVFLAILALESLVLVTAYPVTSIFLLTVVIGLSIIGIFNEHYLMKRYYHKIVKIHSVNNIDSKTLYRVYRYIPKNSKNNFLARVVKLSYEMYSGETDETTIMNWLSFIESILILHPTANIDYNGSLSDVEELYEALASQQWYASDNKIEVKKTAVETEPDSRVVLYKESDFTSLGDAPKDISDGDNVFPDHEKNWVGDKV